MPLPAFVIQAHAGWSDKVRDLLPGAHVAVLTDNADVGIEGRLADLELRDTILVLRSGPLASFVFLFRKPIAEPTVAEQMVATGTGSLNVGGCRVDTTGGTQRGSQVPYEGRWPSNVVLVHGSGCRNVGERKLERGGWIKRVNSGTKTGSVFGTYGELATPQYGGDDGIETVTAWECMLGCPVALLDGQSGDCRSAGDYPSEVTTRRGATSFKPTQGQLYADSGGASRFYPQFTGEGDLQVWIKRLVTPDARAG